MRLATFAATALCATAALATPVARSAHKSHPLLEVQIKNGTVKGISLPTFKQEAFLGIPYADPPVRFEHSVARSVKFEGGMFEAGDYSSVCYGIGNDAITTAYPLNQSEDCLSINIVRPAGTTEGDKLPVMFWIHGGGNYQGSSAETKYNGSWIVEQSVEMGTPILFASINYRLLVLGFPAGQEAYDAGVENLGNLDQRLAIRWVQDNIGAFGGDKNKVTVMGESAGGTDILQHLVAYGGRDEHLFRAAIVESGSFYQVNCTWNITEQTQANWDSLLSYTGCADLACLKALDTANVTAAALAFWDTFLPSIDGNYLPEHPVQLYDERKFINVPLLMGVNMDEGTILSTRGCNNESDMAAGLISLNQSSYVVFEDQIQTLFKAYPDDPEQGIPLHTGDGLLSTGTQDKRINSLFNDAIEHSPRRWITGLLADAGSAVFSYHFQQVPWGNDIETGATHATEIPYVFSNPTNLGPRAKDARLAQFMTRSWVAFVHNLDPTHSSLKWPRYNTRTPKNMVFRGSGSFIQDDTYRSAGIELWTQQRIRGCKNLAPKHQLA